MPVAIMLVIWFVFLIVGIQHFDIFLQQFPNIWVQYSYGNGILNQFSYFILIIFACITMLLYGVIIAGICMILMNSFISPFVVSFVHKTYFSHIATNQPNFIESLQSSSILFITTLSKFLALSLICYCLSFIGLGFIGVLISVFLYFRFFSINLNHEIALNIMQKQDYDMLLRHNKIPLIFINIAIFIPLYIPFFNVFITVWQMLVLSHFMLDWYSQYITSNYDFQDIQDAEILEIET